MSRETGATKRVVAVQIAGHQYRIRSDGDADGLLRIAGYVDRAMQRVKERTGTVDSLDVAVLTCLNLAREILSLREERAPAGAAVVEAEQLRGLIERVEELLPGPLAPERSSDDVDDLESARTAASAEVGARTLELPTPEALRERDGATGQDVKGAAPPRVAASGGDRAS
jgi:cell division protein ZapA (FtsZ GTPase activity inhibitor)